MDENWRRPQFISKPGSGKEKEEKTKLENLFVAEQQKKTQGSLSDSLRMRPFVMSQPRLLLFSNYGIDSVPRVVLS